MTICQECGFAYDELSRSAIAGRLRSSPARFEQALAGIPERVARSRPQPEVWSGLEYMCHVRDVLLVQRDRAVLALVEQRPHFARMYRDERVELCRYGEQQIGEVLRELAMAAGMISLVFEGLGDHGWDRPIVYNWPEPAELDVAWLGRHTVHEVEHHLQDVVSVLAQVTKDAGRSG